MRAGRSDADCRIGIVGSGFVARGLVMALARVADLTVARVLTRSDPRARGDFPRPELLTNSLARLISSCDLVVECSGDVVHATEVLGHVIDHGLPVVTMDAELHVTTGSFLAAKGGLITEAEGDQPGCLAALREDVLAMGFQPLVYGNVKGFLNLDPSLEEMRYWSKRQGISLQQVTSFTDGTKVQVEQALVANGLGATIARPGLTGVAVSDLETGALEIAAAASAAGQVVSDFIVCAQGPPGVFIVATHEEEQAPYLRYYKLGDGPFYTIVRPHHLCHREIVKTIRRVLGGGGALLNNGLVPEISVAAIAMREVRPGAAISRGIGTFGFRGSSVRIADEPNHVPIGLLHDARAARAISPGQIVTFDDVELPQSVALEAWLHTCARVSQTTAQALTDVDAATLLGRVPHV